MKDFLKAYTRYAEFEGRSDRKEFWYYVLFYVLVSAILQVIDATIFGGQHTFASGGGWNGAYEFQPLTSIFGLASLIPSISVSVRRLHDTGRSGWWVLLWLLPIVGWIILLIWYCQRGKPESNAYGEPPEGSQLEI